MKHTVKWLFIVITVFLMASCQKEFSLETGNGGAPVGGGNSGGVTAVYGWSLKGNGGASYRGCIDTAYFTTTAGRRSLNIQGTDSANNIFSVIFLPISGTITPGTYKVSDGVVMMLEDNSGSYVSQPPASLTVQVTSVNDTLIVASFSGTLTDMSNPASTIQVSTGQMRVLIGKANPCNQLNPGGGISTAEFTLSGTGASCSNAAVTGDYIRGSALKLSNQVDLYVNVTKPGVWTVTTTPTNGITFSNYGSFNSTGLQTITLYGIGTPTKAGDNIIPITVGTTNCNFTVAVDTPSVVIPGNGDYFPATANSKWDYYIETSSGTYSSDTIATVSNGTSRTVGTETYSVFDRDIFASVYRKANGEYYRYGYIDFNQELDTSDTQAEMIFLKETAAKGTSWESPAGTGKHADKPVKYKMKFTIMETGISITVMNKTYNNVITVKEELMVDAGTGYVSTVNYISNYAKGIGLIKFSIPAYQVVADLKRFQVF
jgi:hypothetical protein